MGKDTRAMGNTIRKDLNLINLKIKEISESDISVPDGLKLLLPGIYFDEEISSYKELREDLIRFRERCICQMEMIEEKTKIKYDELIKQLDILIDLIDNM